MLGISKRGDTALRTLLMHGARAVIRMAANKPEMTDSWVMKLCRRRHKKHRRREGSPRSVTNISSRCHVLARDGMDTALPSGN
ncbi:hypothetical protein [Paraburkholderia dilworthii]|uniref:hypothetical protein n=1 Tax=Paraburkholderia dilworthii TaxID=948106 RepID=UPI001ADFB2BD